MVDALVTIAVDGILKNVLSIVANEIVLAWGYKEKLTTLCKMMEMIRAKLRSAEKQKGNEVVMLWLKELKEVVVEADDVLDEVHYEMLRCEVKKRYPIARKVPSLPNFKKFAFRREMGHKIENISKKLSEINKRAKDLGLHDEQVGPVLDSSHQETDSFLDEFNIVGRESETLHIIELLTRSKKEEKLIIVPVVGMGGIGKTTLAKSVYNNKKIEEHFDVRTWLCVSVKVDVNTLLAKIYESLARKRCKVPTRENLIMDLRKELGAKRYFLVLDDVWDEKPEHWDDFRSCMLKVNAQNGTGILITTRNLEIGNNDMRTDSYVIKGLSNDQCWSIFEERAFVAGRPPMPELVELGHDIVKKCCGLPLVVKVIGSMLRCYNDKEKWLSIIDSKVWDLEGGERVRSTLKLSFDNLPNSIVKQCFSYCSIFEKDTVIQKEELIQLWMALGLLQAEEKRNKEMEDVGNDIFQTLVSNSLFQDVEMDEYGYIVGCKMHDLVHDLCLSLSENESLCLVGLKNDDMPISQVKHLAICQDPDMSFEIKISFENMISKVFEEKMMARTLQTLSFDGEVEENISFHNFKCLRILSFGGCTLKKIHDSIGELVHLRYLDLSFTEIIVLPKSIGKLYHLQTLKLRNCYHLKELPEELRNLISLRNFEFDASRVSPKVGQFTSLRKLSSFSVGKEKGCQIEELGHMKHLRGKLRICNLEELSSSEDASKADLSGKRNLFEIVFRWSKSDGDNRNDKDVLEGLQPHANVKSLKIKKFSSENFPAWVAKMAINIQEKWVPLEKLVAITLTKCCNCLNLPMLQELPLLRKLKLEHMDKLTCLSSSLGQGNDITGSRKPLSPSLRSLKLIGMKSLEKWTDATTNNSTMLSPVLKKLVIRDCPNIILLDECHLHPLISLQIHNCENLKSIRSIHGLTCLESLRISKCPSLLGIPDLHNQGHSLKDLTLMNCNKLTSLPGGFDRLAFLSTLSLGWFSKELHSFPCLKGIEKLRDHLHSLELMGWNHWESMPEEIEHLTSLTSLFIHGFGMQELPGWLTNMSSIRFMHLSGCMRLDDETVLRGVPREANEVFFNEGFLKMLS